MKAGSTNHVIFNMAQGAGIRYWSGMKMSTVLSPCEQICRLLKQHNHNAHAIFMPFYQMVLTITGNLSALPSAGELGSDSTPDPSKSEMANSPKHSFFASYFYFYKVYVAFIFRKLDECCQLIQSLPSFTHSSQFFFYSQAMRTLYEGLASFWIGREKNDKRRMAKGRAARAAMAKLVESASRWNFQNKLFLLEA